MRTVQSEVHQGRWVGPRSVNRVDALGSSCDLTSPAVNGPGVSALTSVTPAVACTGRASRMYHIGVPQNPGNGECAGPGSERSTRGRLVPAGSGTRPPRCHLLCLRPGLRLDLSPLRHVSWSLGLQPGLLASCPVTAHCDLGPGPRGCGDHREGHWLVDNHNSLSGVCAWEGLWSVGFLLSPQGTHFSRVFQMLGKQGLKSSTLSPSLALPGTSSKSLNFQNLQAFPNFSFPSSSYSIITCLSLVVHLEPTQPFKCLSFSYSQ